MFDNDTAFIFFPQWKRYKQFLSESEWYRLLGVVVEYGTTGNVIIPDDDPLMLAFCSIREYIDTNRKKYSEVSERNRRNGQNGGAPSGNSNARKSRSSDGPSVDLPDGPQWSIMDHKNGPTRSIMDHKNGPTRSIAQSATVVGYNGIMELFGVKLSQAKRYRNTFLEPAITKVGSQIVVDVRKALQLKELYDKEHHSE